VKTSSKSSVKVAAKKAAPKVAVKAKTAAKTASTAAVKAKPAAKVVKAPAKPVKAVKPAVKKPAPSKVAVKAPVKAPVKTVAKPKSKSKPTSVAVKAVAKVATQSTPPSPAKSAAKAPTPADVKARKALAIPKKALVKTVAPAAVKAAAKSLPKEVLNSAKAIAKAPIAPPSEKVKSPAKAVAPKAAPAVLAPVLVIAPAAPGDVPARATRPSARLAQITVPSMPQSVASTAAKASYLHNTPTQVMIPVFTAPAKKDAKLANNWKTKKVDQLVDAEILAMSDDDYMNAMQLAFFRRKLVLLKDDMLANAGQTTENLREDTVVVPDPADRATIEEEHALELRTRDRERKLLKKIEQSITRIDSGEYGYCDETGEPIGVGRLLARPTATLSLEAQQRRELKQKMFGD